VLSPSTSSDDRIAALGIPAERIARWDRGVDLARFSPERRVPGLLDPARINVLYSGRLTREKGVDLLADAFLEAPRLRPALQLVLAGGGPEEATLRERLGDAATFLGWLEGDALAAAYASADLFLFCSQTDTYGQVLLEAQASGLPIVAVAAGGPGELVAHGRSGLLARPRGARRRPRRPRRLAVRAPAALRRRAARGSGPLLGRPRWAAWPRAGSSRRRAGAPPRPAPPGKLGRARGPGWGVRDRRATGARRRSRSLSFSRRASAGVNKPLPAALERDALEHVGRRLARVDGGLERLEDVLPADHDHRVDASREQ
jgi:hypothetical protein